MTFDKHFNKHLDEARISGSEYHKSRASLHQLYTKLQSDFENAAGILDSLRRIHKIPEKYWVPILKGYKAWESESLGENAEWDEMEMEKEDVEFIKNNNIPWKWMYEENAEETAEQRIAAAKQAVAQAKGQIAQAKIQGQMKHYGDGLAKALGKSENAEGQPMTQQNKMPVTYIHLDLYTGKTSVIPQREFQQAIDGLEKVRGKMTVYKGEEYMVLVVPIPGTR